MNRTLEVFNKEPEYNKYGYATLAITKKAYQKIKDMIKALEKISDYQMPKMTIPLEDVTLANMAELCMNIQDMAGIARRVINE